MINKIDPSRDVPITVSMSQSALALDMTLMALLVPKAAFDEPDRVQYFTDEDSAALAFATQAKAFTAFFAQSPRPERIAVGQIATADLPGKLIGAALTDAQITALEALAPTGVGSVKITIAGSPVSITAINLGSANTAAKIATAISGGTGFPAGATCTAVGNSIVFSTGTSDGDAQTITFASAASSGTDLSAALNWTEATGALLSQGHTFGTLVVEAALVKQASINNGYPIYGWCLDSTYRDVADQKSFADWVLAQKLAYTSLCSNAAGNYNSGSETSTTSYYINTASSNRRADVAFSDSESQYPDVSILARMLAVDYSGVMTAITAKFKDLIGLTPVNLTSSQLDILLAKRCNCMTLMGNAARVFREGTTGDHSWFIDDTINIDNFFNELETAMYNVFVRNGKVPYTPEGRAMQISAAAEICEKYKTNGVLADRPVRDTGTQSGFSILKAYSITAPGVETATAAMRASRTAPLLQITLYLASAIHTSPITINVIQ